MNKKIFYPRIWQSILLVAIGLGLQIVAGVVVGIFLAVAKMPLNDIMIATLVASPICTFLAALVGIFISKVSIKKYIFNKLDNKMKLLYCFLFFLGVYFVSLLIGGILETFIPTNDSLNTVFTEGFNSWIGILAIVVLAPIFEELLFRGVILRGFLKNYSPAASVIITAVMFGVFHFNLVQSITAGILGLALGWIFVKTGSLWICMLFHAMYNGFSTLIYHITSSGNVSDTALVLIMIPSIIIGAVSAILLARKPDNISHILLERDEALKERFAYEAQQAALQASFMQNNPYAYQTAGYNMNQFSLEQKGYYPAQDPPKHSALGIASFSISLGIMALEIAGFIMLVASAISLKRQVLGFATVYAVGAILGSIVNLAGIGLGIAGALQKNKKKVLSILGIIFNSVTILAFIFLVVIGLVMSNAGFPGGTPFPPGSNPFTSGGINL